MSHNPADRLTVEPLREWILERVAKHGGSYVELGRSLDVDEALLRKIVNGSWGCGRPLGSIGIATADRILLAGGAFISEVWPPDEGPVSEGYCPECQERVLTAEDETCLWCDAPTAVECVAA